MQDATIRARVTQLVDGVLGGKGVTRPIAADERLVDAGLTSMDMVNLMLGVEAEFDLMIPSSEITPDNFRTVASIAALVGRVVPADAA